MTQLATAADTSVATYVFAVCLRQDAPVLAGVTGHPEGAAVRTVSAGALAAVAQDVPAAAFAAEALRERLADRDELERYARAHHEVVTAVARAAPAVPLPLATLYLGEERARTAIAREARRFLTALDRVAGRAEWGVKAYTATGPAPVDDPAPGTGGPQAGRAYLDRVRGREQARNARQEAVWQAAERVDAALRPLSVAARRLRAHGAEATGGGRRQVLNAAYLVDAGRAPELTARVAALRQDPEAGGRLVIEVTGPWPPYSFTGGSGTDGDG